MKAKVKPIETFCILMVLIMLLVLCYLPLARAQVGALRNPAPPASATPREVRLYLQSVELDAEHDRNMQRIEDNNQRARERERQLDRIRNNAGNMSDD